MMKVESGGTFSRALTGRCPNCGQFGMFKNWFRLHKRCLNCGMELEKEESGFYFGTTSIGYVLSIILVIIPVCILVVMDIAKHVGRRGHRYRWVHYALHPTLSAHALLANHALLRSSGR